MKKILRKSIIYVVVISVVAGAYLYNDYKIKEEPDFSSMTEEEISEWNVKRTKHTSYVKETVYDGADVPYILYDIPFKSQLDETAGFKEGYKSNKDLYKSLDEDIRNDYQNKAIELMDLLFNTSYTSVVTDTDAYMDKLLTHYKTNVFTDDIESEPVDEQQFCNSYIEFFVDNKITCDSTFKTDKSLFYRSSFYYTTRGVLYLTVTSDSHIKGEPCEPFKELYGLDINYGEETAFIDDIGYSPVIESKELQKISMSSLEFVKSALYED